MRWTKTSPAWIVVENIEGSTSSLPSMFSITIQPDDVYVHRTAGGGGWGDAATRDPARREADLADGKVTA